MTVEIKRYFAGHAWVHGAWARDVLLTVDDAGHWRDITAAAPLTARSGATVLDGPVLPALVNAHSHAFQRAIAGLTECRSVGMAGASDDFWSWRDRMYSVARHISPEQLESIAAFLYAELLTGGYTQVCEFHYLHNAADGAPHADPLDMSLALVRAARRVGMGLTLLPTLYMHSGFGVNGLHEGQRRFAGTPDSVMRLVQDLQRETRALAGINIGLAIHSLRAVDAASLQDVAAEAARMELPVHIHIAEQTQEVQECLAHTAQRPIEWLLNKIRLDARWNLVHATHTNAAELRGVRDSGAAIVICPSTEANLGDGVFDYSGYAGLGGQWSIGSDSHVTRSWTEELRLLEYSQRLTQRRRNVAAQTDNSASSAAALFEAALSGGRSATSIQLGAIELGHRADFLVLDLNSPALLGVPTGNLLDALVFSSPSTSFDQVYVAGNQVVASGEIVAHGNQPISWGAVKTDFLATMNCLWQ